jgi:predicted HTH transcriptional regulator
MQSNPKKDNSLLFKLITLLTFGLTLFLIIFLKQDKGKKVEQPKKERKPEKGRVKITPQTPRSVKRGKQVRKKLQDFRNLNERQIKILGRMKEEGVMDPSEIYSLVPGVSTRTVRRDMDKLADAGFVSQKGTTKSTQYIYNPQQHESNI